MTERDDFNEGRLGFPSPLDRYDQHRPWYTISVVEFPLNPDQEGVTLYAAFEGRLYPVRLSRTEAGERNPYFFEAEIQPFPLQEEMTDGSGYHVRVKARNRDEGIDIPARTDRAGLIGERIELPTARLDRQVYILSPEGKVIGEGRCEPAFPSSLEGCIRL